ncbi:MAG: type II secretion system protein [Candidatus Omnitrophota bacterium]|nr:type II secretion system protein [Candidatus Omnitrophota bacterium]
MVRVLTDIRGMTLVEVLVTAVLISIVTVSLIATVVQSSSSSRHIDMVYTSSFLAQRRIDLMKRFDFDEVPAAEETDVRIGADGTIDTEGDYFRTTGVYTSSNPYLLRVKVSVDRDVDGSPSGYPVVMETYFVDSDEVMIYMHGK